MILADQVASLEAELNHFDPRVRAQAFDHLATLLKRGEVSIANEQDVANMHCHTFFSFNAYGYSPTALAWLAKKNGYPLMGMVDFDVLDGVDEFLDACQRLGIRGSAGMETRVFIPEFSTREINSPGEPGVSYYMGAGFSSSRVPQEARAILEDLRQRATLRNRMVMERVNSYLSPVCIDYENDVLPLTPSGNPTERHLVQAYLNAAEKNQSDLPRFWASRLGLSHEQVDVAMQDTAKFQNLVRTKLMKRGGVGYIEPEPETFPSIQEVNRLLLACGAIPCITWLDGTSQGEQDIQELLDLLIEQGASALNIVPDRNWNIADEKVKKTKLERLYEIVHLAAERDLPLNIGTEMNSFGQRLVDDFNAPELQPVRQPFLDGAYCMYGHTILQRTLGLGYETAWAKTNFPQRHERIQFYTQFGYHIPPGIKSIEKLRTLGPEVEPKQLLLLA